MTKMVPVGWFLLTLVVAPPGALAWEKVGGQGVHGSWDYLSCGEVHDGVAFDGRLCVSTDAWDCNGVWCWDGAGWERLGGDGVNGSWSSMEYTTEHLATVAGRLYAAINNGGEGSLWEYDPTVGLWSQIGGSGVLGPWIGRSLRPESLAALGGSLLVGVGNGVNGAQAWRYEPVGRTWTLTAGYDVNGSWPVDFYRNIPALAAHGAMLCASLQRRDSTDIWCEDAAGWRRIGGNGLSGSWTDADELEIQQLASWDGRLWAGGHVATGGNDAVVWSFDGAAWVEVGGHARGPWVPTSESRILSLAPGGDALLVGVGNGSTGWSQVWAFDGAWRALGGPGVPGSWPDRTYTQIDLVILYECQVFAGLGGQRSRNGAELWRHEGVLDCDDGDPCTVDSCDPAGCRHEPECPDCSRAVASPAAIWPPNHGFVAVGIDGVVDPGGQPVTITIDSIRQDEQTETLGDGNTCPDALGVGGPLAYLRAERVGAPRIPGDGRVYHVGFTATTPRGKSCSGVVTSCAAHDQGRRDACSDQGPLHDSTACEGSSRRTSHGRAPARRARP